VTGNQVPFEKTEKGRLLDAVNRYNIDLNVVYDCGSRDAFDSIELRKLFNPRQIHIFECNPEAVHLCKRNIEQYLSESDLDIYFNESAISDKTGSIEFFAIDTEQTRTKHQGGNIGASSLLRASTTYKNETYVQRQITVPSIRLEDYFSNHASPDLMWMDLQGAELMAFRGMGSRLSEVSIIHVEVGFRSMYDGQPLFGEVYDLLKPHFHLDYIDTGRWPSWPHLYKRIGFGPWIANAIFVNKRFLS
jgi:FkbM family methyltransferase